MLETVWIFGVVGVENGYIKLLPNRARKRVHIVYWETKCMTIKKKKKKTVLKECVELPGTAKLLQSVHVCSAVSHLSPSCWPEGFTNSGTIFPGFYFPGVPVIMLYVMLQVIYFGRPWNYVHLTTWETLGRKSLLAVFHLAASSALTCCTGSEPVPWNVCMTRVPVPLPTRQSSSCTKSPFSPWNVVARRCQLSVSWLALVG